jgi:hypothetical protein
METQTAGEKTGHQQITRKNSNIRVGLQWNRCGWSRLAGDDGNWIWPAHDFNWTKFYWEKPL